jgi:hypothetical protein
MIETKNKNKKIMTDLAAGHITKLEADELINSQEPRVEEKRLGRSPDKNKNKFKRRRL